MLAVERRKLFLSIITEQGNATVSHLAQIADVTEETVRRDLYVLEKEGSIIKTHGGAIFNEGSGADVSSELRQKINYHEKIRVAKEAVKLVKKNDTIFLDSSTTSLFFAKEIKKMSDITVVTNSLHILNELSGCTNMRVISTGGQFVPKNQSFVGSAAQSFVRQNYYVNKAFFSCRGIAKNGLLLESDEQECAIKAEMLKAAAETVLIVDNSKFGRFGSIKLCSISSISLVITDDKKAVALDHGVRVKKIIIAQ